jgi:hypothetical protein
MMPAKDKPKRRLFNDSGRGLSFSRPPLSKSARQESGYRCFYPAVKTISENPKSTRQSMTRHYKLPFYPALELSNHNRTDVKH